jgi:hypothetical protein
LLAVGVVAMASAASTTDAKLSFTIKGSEACTEEQCNGPVSGTISAFHRLAVTTSELVGLRPETSVTVTIPALGVTLPFQFSDDPRFANGDTSATIKKTVSYFTPTSNYTIALSCKFRWNIREFTMSLTGKLNGTLAGPAPFLTKSVAKGAKVAPQEQLITTVERLSVPVFNATAYMTGDAKESTAIFHAAEGGGTQKVTQSFKSKRLIPAP